MQSVSMHFDRRRSGGLFFYGIFVQSLFMKKPFVSFLLLIFLFSFWLCPFLKNRIFWFGFICRLFCVLFNCGKV